MKKFCLGDLRGDEQQVLRTVMRRGTVRSRRINKAQFLPRPRYR